MIAKILVNNSIKIYYKIKKGRKTPLVFLHGGGSSLSAWDVIIPYFQKRNNTCVTVDFRGHGLSDRLQCVEDYFLEKHAEDLYKIIKKEKLGQVILIGHCLGSMVGATFASIYPNKVEKLILVNTGYELPWFMREIFILPILQYLALLKTKFIRTSKMSRINYFKYQGTSDIHLGRLLADLEVMGIASASKQFLAWFKWDGRKYFSKLTVPTLVIAGRKDSLFPPSMAKKVVKLIEHARLDWVNSNHISIINKPKEVYAKIAQFL